jgi:hypothetical protein
MPSSTEVTRGNFKTKYVRVLARDTAKVSPINSVLNANMCINL